jgi:hypothetical protein
MSDTTEPQKSTYLIVLHKANCQHNLGGMCNCEPEIDIRTGIELPAWRLKRRATNHDILKIDTKQE